MAKSPSYFGKFPCLPGEKKPTMVTKADCPKFIYTPERPHASDLNWIFASTDHLTCGQYQLAPGSTFDPVDVHSGDEVYYVLEGTVTMFNPKLGQVEDVSAGEVILLPKEAPHKAYNFTNKKAVIFFVIAPKRWEESGPPDGYYDTMKLLKYEKEEGKE